MWGAKKDLCGDASLGQLYARRTEYTGSMQIKASFILREYF